MQGVLAGSRRQGKGILHMTTRIRKEPEHNIASGIDAKDEKRRPKLNTSCSHRRGYYGETMQGDLMNERCADEGFGDYSESPQQ